MSFDTPRTTDDSFADPIALDARRRATRPTTGPGAFVRRTARRALRRVAAYALRRALDLE
ncbi:MAG: hypothetical protein EA355_12845 [Rhodobacteraceae bacterium]|nr:MAG: hypothetical protein EA355_12845 [Paracoccaceae bacterium]